MKKLTKEEADLLKLLKEPGWRLLKDVDSGKFYVKQDNNTVTAYLVDRKVANLLIGRRLVRQERGSKPWDQYHHFKAVDSEVVYQQETTYGVTPQQKMVPLRPLLPVETPIQRHRLRSGVSKEEMINCILALISQLQSNGEGIDVQKGVLDIVKKDPPETTYTIEWEERQNI